MVILRKLKVLVLVLSLTAAILPGLDAKASVEAEENNAKVRVSSNELLIRYEPIKGSSIISNSNEDYQIEASEKFLNSLAKKFKFKLQNKLKNKGFKKLFKKVKKSKFKANGELALIELSHKISAKQMKRLINAINKIKFHDQNFQLSAAYPNAIYEIDNVVTNDPSLKNQGYLNNIKLDSAWEYSQGDGVVVAVIDTGVDYTHKDLAANIWRNEDEIPNNGIDDDGNGFIDDVRGWDFVANAGKSCSSREDCKGRDNDPMDVQGHGTHVSGIIAAVSNNQIGISGVAPKAKIMPLRAGYAAGRSGLLKTSDILDSLSYAINNEADVINMSFAGGSLNILRDILNLASDLGIVLVAAAGNSGSSFKNYPAAFPNVISVGAVSSFNNKAYFSNFGDWVDIYAPGTSIYSTLPGNKYDYQSGTSMAAPVIAGLAALIKSKSKVSKLSAEEVKDILLDSASSKETGILNLTIASADLKFPVSVDEMDFQENVALGENVVFSATATDGRTDVVEYEWMSDIDGFLSDEAAFVDANLSEGVHTISLRAKNKYGEWSKPVYKALKVNIEKQTQLGNFDNSIKFKLKRKKRNNGRKVILARLAKKSKAKVASFKWISSKDGDLGSTRVINANKLSPGFHKVSLLVQDLQGNWSEPVTKVLKI